MRVLVSPDKFLFSGDGAYNMALDEAIFEEYQFFNESVLRFYCFHEATITIPIRYDGNDLCPEKITSKSVELSRRISGGKYLLHQLGLTYALFMPKNHPSISGLSLKNSYRTLSYPILKALKKLNNAVEFLRCIPGANQNKDCASETEVESMGINGVKFVGAAQKRGRNCLMQHGEIQLLSSPLGLGNYLRNGINKETCGLDAEIDFTDLKTSLRLVCQPEPSDKADSKLLFRLREKVASNILNEYEKVFGESHHDQIESTLINRAVECRKKFEISLR